jgi:YD repeat-containing protein
MTRTKFNLNPPVVTTETTTTDGSGHYQFTVYSRCGVVEEFKASVNGVEFQGGISTSGCVLNSNGELNFLINIGSNLQNAGVTSCNTSIPRPVNVTNGNMYLQQTDYQLPGAGEAIVISRTYNSISTNAGLFGRGWSTAYDETISTDINSRLQLAMPDGRLVNFATPDFFGQMVKNGDGSYTVTFKDGRVHQFNSAGKLVSQTDRQGNQTTLGYNSSGSLISITDPFGRILSITTNVSGRVLSISDTIGTIATYTYGSDQVLLSVTYADNSRFQYSYTLGLLLTTVTDALGNIVEHHDYDSQGRATTSETHGGVERYTLNYVSLSETDVTDALGHVTKYFYNNIRGRRVVKRVEGNCSCGNSQVQTWTYDNQSNVTAKADALGHTTTYTYDANGNRLAEIDPSGTLALPTINLARC